METAADSPKTTLRGLFVLMTCATAILALCFPGVRTAREAARRMQCSNNLKQLVLGIHNYHSAYRSLPQSFQPHSQLSWTVSVGNFFEATGLFNQLQMSGSGPYYGSGKNDPHGLIRLTYHLCPSSEVDRMQLNPPHDASPLDLVPVNTGKAPYTIHYYGISGPTGKRADGGGDYPIASPLTHEGSAVAGSGVFQWNSQVRFDSITDGLSNTLCFGEMSWESERYGTRYRSWLHGGTDGSYLAGCRNITRPINSHKQGSVLKPFNDMPMGSQHSGGAQFGVSDGLVRFLHQSIDLAVYQAMASRNGFEIDQEKQIFQELGHE